MADREDAFQAAANDMPDTEALRLVNRERVRLDSFCTNAQQQQSSRTAAAGLYAATGTTQSCSMTGCPATIGNVSWRTMTSMWSCNIEGHM